MQPETAGNSEGTAGRFAVISAFDRQGTEDFRKKREAAG
jgi:hypothetical protein